MASTAELVKIPEAKTIVSERPLSPALKSWIKNCIVPILVQEYLAAQRIYIASVGSEVVESVSATAARMGR